MQIPISGKINVATKIKPHNLKHPTKKSSPLNKKKLPEAH